MSDKAARRVAREAVAAYHERCLAELVERVGVEIDRFRAGELDAYMADLALFQYSRAAKELWKFCNLGHVDVTARWIVEEPAVDWWDVGAPKDSRRGS